ncbi:MAG: hypothetical protein HY952_02930 [Elusimicrobia bacterium]|nr:hypothetical protein [Elusimicrobiota bacterium]
MKHITLTLAVLLLAACAMPQPGGMVAKKRGFMESAGGVPTDQFVDEVVEVVTVPPGAQVRVNEGLVGVSPLKVSVRRYWQGQAGYLILDMVKIEALPAAAGQCMQSGVFGHNNLKVPSPVRFTMTNCANAYEYGAAGVSKPAFGKK